MVWCSMVYKRESGLSLGSGCDVAVVGLDLLVIYVYLGCFDCVGVLSCVGCKFAISSGFFEAKLRLSLFGGFCCFLWSVGAFMYLFG